MHNCKNIKLINTSVNINILRYKYINIVNQFNILNLFLYLRKIKPTQLLCH
jgi:hypothetical protein